MVSEHSSLYKAKSPMQYFSFPLPHLAAMRQHQDVLGDAGSARVLPPTLLLEPLSSSGVHAAALGLVSSGNQAKNTRELRWETLHIVGPKQPLFSFSLSYIHPVRLVFSAGTCWLFLILYVPFTVNVPFRSLSLKKHPPSKPLHQILVSFLVIREHPNQQELSMEKIKLQLESEE